MSPQAGGDAGVPRVTPSRPADHRPAPEGQGALGKSRLSDAALLDTWLLARTPRGVAGWLWRRPRSSWQTVCGCWAALRAPSFLTHLELERMPCCFSSREAENSHGGLSAQRSYTQPWRWERQFPQRILVGVTLSLEDSQLRWRRERFSQLTLAQERHGCLPGSCQLLSTSTSVQSSSFLTRLRV